MNFAIETTASSYVPNAFPRALSAQAGRVAQLIPDYHYRLWAYQIKLGDEQLAIPVRLYFPGELLQTPLDDDIAQTMLLCLGSRHHDGHLRQACVAQLLQRKEAWLAPFVIQLLGEYVVEIAEVIRAGLQQVDLAPYRQFMADNPRYIHTVESRIISYWSCYYRHAYPHRADYPASIALTYLQM
ncbi:hypothetical protein KW842_19435 [Duganella sp. sic0402]|uniref:hypothetical protein n=1 Tax=Duganella sp. sic0402 TaxID=2854786 RepID=UPI001C45755C|nr:hypothetical protein [Duganella sp. sic0402]MBV7537949.1 hypothetical protein [Duganella sp. sic0402]